MALSFVKQGRVSGAHSRFKLPMPGRVHLTRAQLIALEGGGSITPCVLFFTYFIQKAEKVTSQHLSPLLLLLS